MKKQLLGRKIPATVALGLVLAVPGLANADVKFNFTTIDYPGSSRTAANGNSRLYLAVLLFASAVYLGCIVSPPSLMDDVDAVQAQIARNRLCLEGRQIHAN